MNEIETLKAELEAIRGQIESLQRGQNGLAKVDQEVSRRHDTVEAALQHQICLLAEKMGIWVQQHKELSGTALERFQAVRQTLQRLDNDLRELQEQTKSLENRMDAFGLRN